MATITSARRRQRSVRVTVAVALMAIATVAVVLAVPTQEPVLLSIAAVVALVLGWAAVRMVWTEVLQSRRENAADRAATATAYQELFSQRAAEHAEFTTAMTDRLAESQMTMRELENALVAEQKRAAIAETDRTSTASKLQATHQRVHQLEQELARRQAELEAAQADALTSWEPVVIEPTPHKVPS